MGEIRVLKMMVADVLTQFISSNDIKLDNDDFKKYTKHITSDVKNKYVITKKKKEKPQLIDKNEICIARKTNNLQCTRQKVISTEFCKAHNKKLPNGRFDEPVKKKIPAKRGRKRKIEINPLQENMDYLTLWEDCVDGEKRLIDKYNNVYTFDVENPIWLGKKSLNDKLYKLPEIQKHLDKEMKLNNKLNGNDGKILTPSQSPEKLENTVNEKIE